MCLDLFPNDLRCGFRKLKEQGVGNRASGAVLVPKSLLLLFLMLLRTPTPAGTRFYLHKYVRGGPKRKYVLKKHVKERGLCQIDNTAGDPFSRDGPPVFPSNSQSEKNQNAHRLRALKIKLAGASCADTWRLRSERTKKVPRRRLCGQRQKRS